MASRFAAAVREGRRRRHGRDLVIATHGMAMTRWLVHAVGLADPAGFWAALTFPDLVRVSVRGRGIERMALPAPMNPSMTVITP